MSHLVVSRPPSALQKNVPVIREVEAPLPIRALMARGELQPGTRYYRMGKAKILLSPPSEHGGWHLSISREDHYPSWDEVVAAWYGLVPNAAQMEGVMHLPPLSDYINVHDYCFQVHQLMETQP